MENRIIDTITKSVKELIWEAPEKDGTETKSNQADSKANESEKDNNASGSVTLVTSVSIIKDESGEISSERGGADESKRSASLPVYENSSSKSDKTDNDKQTDKQQVKLRRKKRSATGEPVNDKIRDKIHDNIRDNIHDDIRDNLLDKIFDDGNQKNNGYTPSNPLKDNRNKCERIEIDPDSDNIPQINQTAALPCSEKQKTNKTKDIRGATVDKYETDPPVANSSSDGYACFIHDDGDAHADANNNGEISIFDENAVPSAADTVPKKPSIFDLIFKRKKYARCEYIEHERIEFAFTGDFDNVVLAQLANSIKERGMLLPITVYETSNGKYSIIDGKKRFFASKLLSHRYICCQILPIDKKYAAVVSRETIMNAKSPYDATKIKENKDLIKEILLMKEKDINIIVSRCNLSKSEKEKLDSANLTAIHNKLAEIKSRSFKEYAISSFIEMFADFESSVLSLIENKDRRYSHSDKIILKDIRIAFNSIDGTLGKIKKSGIEVKSNRKEDVEGYYMEIRVKKP